MAGWLNAGKVFAVAKAAATRRTAQRRRSARYPNDALVAIVFSAAALEAFINEAARLAAQRFAYPPSDRTTDEHPSVEQFASRCLRIERRRGPTSAKFQAASTTLAGKAFAEDQQPYLDFALLMDLRNDIMHAHEDEFMGIRFEGDELFADPPPIALKLARRGLKLGVKPGGMGSYDRWLDSPDVVRWACNAAAAIVHAVLDLVPAPIRPNPDPDPEAPASWALCDALRQFYGEAFTPIS